MVDVTDTASFGLIPPCADPRFDHRTCDYWEDADRGSKASRPSWLEVRAPTANRASPLDDNPFAPPAREEAANPFAPASRAALPDFFGNDGDLSGTPADNPFAPTAGRERPLRDGVPRKLALLDRGRGVFGSYGKVLVADGEPVAYCQFGPLSAYPRALRLRDLYPQLPDAPLPAVITCIASTAEARRMGYARQLVEEVCRDLAERGFAAVEAYPDLTRSEDETSGARPPFWHMLGFETAVDDERFPVMRREL
jgi:ribosomal protein S18 acetylase RimI-like enzyme